MTDYFAPMENIDGFVKKDQPDHADHLCPVCQGYGGWNLRLNAYGPGRHFKAFCSQCNGWGWVKEEDLCVHDMVELSQDQCRKLGIAHWGNLWHVYRCTKCGRVRSYDSSD